ncbi:glycosyltransferase [bacterium]|nr:glycosyltransferase [bacterium]
MRIVALFPQLLGPGGVQRFGCAMAREIQALADEHGGSASILSLLDPDHEMEDVIVRGSSGNRAAFTIKAGLFLPRADLVYIAHPNLSPLALCRSSHAIVHAHGIEVWKPMSRLRRSALQRVALVTSSSEHTRSMVMDVQGRIGATEVLHPPADSEPVRQRWRGDFVLTVARLNRDDVEKGVDRLIAVYTSFDSAQLPILKIVGDGDDRRRLEALAAGCTRIEFLGKVSDRTLRDLYRDCGVFALPSTKEGFGMVYAEAMGFGRPALGCPAGGVPDVIADGRNGFLIPQDDTSGWRDAIMRLFSDDELYRQLSQSAHEDTRDRFSREAFGRRFQSLLLSVLEARR